MVYGGCETSYFVRFLFLSSVKIDNWAGIGSCNWADLPSVWSCNWADLLIPIRLYNNPCYCDGTSVLLTVTVRERMCC